MTMISRKIFENGWSILVTALAYIYSIGAILLLFAMALMLAGCASTQFVPVAFETPKPAVPNECVSRPPSWPAIKAGDKGASVEDVARTWRVAKGRFYKLRRDHAVCGEFARQIGAKPGAG